MSRANPNLSMNNNLISTVNFAKEIVEGLNQDILTLEHMFLAMLKNQYARDVLISLGVNIDTIGDIIFSYLRKHIPIRQNLNSQDAVPTPAFAKVFEHMELNVESANKRVMGLADFLVAIMSEHDCYSTKLLNARGIRLDTMKSVVVNMEETSASDEVNVKNKRTPQIDLSKYAKNLNKLAKEGKIDPLIGRDKEINQIIQILCRRKKNNPILLGEAGVGKSAIIEGLALRIVENCVPYTLKNMIIYSIDLSSLVAGTKYRGEFEGRIQKILGELEKNENAIIFLDEIHTIIGAGQAQSGNMDLSNILKPRLASGKIRCIGATTFNEYKLTIDKDKALARRFTQVKIDEPTVKECLLILEKLAPIYEKFHKIKYSKESLSACVNLSDKYISERFLPDKAIDLLDEIGAKIQLENNSNNNLESIMKSNSKQKNILIKENDIEELVSSIVNIPKSSMSSDESLLLKNLESKLKKRIFSQDEAIEQIVQKIKINKSGLGELNKPIANFLFSGPSGVGKTELSKELAKILGIKFERIDMSEYSESHSVSKLIGSPAGYVGYQEGGFLVSKIRTTPHCVLLLDEIEKAHSDIYNILLQIMDSATLTDNQGNKADFKNVILIMTSNAGSKEGRAMGFIETSINRINKAIKDAFSPEFRSRLDAVINFNPLTQKEFQKIAEKYVNDLSNGLKDKNISLKITPKASKFIAQISIDSELGAREIKKIVDREVKIPLSDAILFGKLKKHGHVLISLKDEKIHIEFNKSAINLNFEKIEGNLKNEF